MTVSILIGDVREKLRELPSDHFDCVVTSPPYWGLRDYGTGKWEGGDPACDHRSPTMRADRKEDRPALAGSAATNSQQLRLAHSSACGKCGAVKVDAQIGLEPTLGEHLAVMVEVFEEVKRVLKPTGTLWVNYGDCYATSPNGRSAADTKAAGSDDRTFHDKPFSTVGPIYVADPRDADRRGGKSALQGPQTLHTPGRIGAGGVLKAKDLCMVPNRLAIAMQEAGWWVRSEIIWAKPNPMPESIKDRPATSHEKIFMFAKSGTTTIYRSRDTGQWSLDPDLSERIPAPTDDDPDATLNRWRGFDYYYDGPAVRQSAASSSVARWAQDVEAQEGSHRANGGRKTNGTMKAVGGPRTKNRASDIAAPRHAGHINHTGIEETPRGEGRSLRNYEPAPVQVWTIATRPFSEAHFATFPPELAERCLVAGCPRGGRVLDPFGGAGTTALVADALGLDCTLIELNPDYAEIAARRLRAGLVRVEGVAHSTAAGPLFDTEAA
jgi:DNA modification methylase